MTYIIGEVGSNFLSLQDALDSIVSLKECGADAVKFQMFSHKDMYGYGDETKNLSEDDIQTLSLQARDLGIDFGVTFFDHEDVWSFEEQVDFFKVASSDLCNTELLTAIKEVIYQKPKRVFLSTGGSNYQEIGTAVNFFGDKHRDLITTLHCVSAYPSVNPNLGLIRALRGYLEDNKDCDVGVGYSCHTMDKHAAIEAVQSYRADVIEKHFMLSPMDTPDAPHSLNPLHFKEMVDAIRDMYKYEFLDRYNDQEEEFRWLHKRRLVATKPIKQGEPFTRENVGCYRVKEKDSKGLSGFLLDSLIGNPCSLDIEAFKPITARHIAD